MRLFIKQMPKFNPHKDDIIIWMKSSELNHQENLKAIHLQCNLIKWASIAPILGVIFLPEIKIILTIF